jgi:diamine N-acetyltransferase
MPLLIRFAEINDAPLIADISRSTFYDTFAEFNTKENMDKFMNGPFSTESLVNEVAAPGNMFLLAFIDDEAVGYVRMREDAALEQFKNMPAIEIARIYASQHAIGKGVGKALMQKCIDVARAKNNEMIWLGVWEHNRRAIDFYTKWGFEKFGEHEFVLGDDVQTDWLMKRGL